MSQSLTSYIPICRLPFLCPLWVKSGPKTMSAFSPHSSQLRTQPSFNPSVAARL